VPSKSYLLDTKLGGEHLGGKIDRNRKSDSGTESRVGVHFLRQKEKTEARGGKKKGSMGYKREGGGQEREEGVKEVAFWGGNWTKKGKRGRPISGVKTGNDQGQPP